MAKFSLALLFETWVMPLVRTLCMFSAIAPGHCWSSRLFWLLYGKTLMMISCANSLQWIISFHLIWWDSCMLWGLWQNFLRIVVSLLPVLLLWRLQTLGFGYDLHSFPASRKPFFPNLGAVGPEVITIFFSWVTQLGPHQWLSVELSCCGKRLVSTWSSCLHQLSSLVLSRWSEQLFLLSH